MSAPIPPPETHGPEPASVDGFATVRAWWDRQPYLAALSISLVHLAAGEARLRLERTDTNVAGVRNSINGGVQASLAELAAHVALRTVLEQGARVAHTQEVSISYLNSARSEWHVAEASVLRHGRLSVVDVSIAVGNDRGERTGELGVIEGACE